MSPLGLTRTEMSALAASPFPGQQLVGADPVGVVVGDGGDDQLVGAGRLLKLLEPVGDRAQAAARTAATGV
ncbi:MAG: hypothetical protein ACLQB1_28700 [Streptosporangiaceae bacterium]